MSLGGSVEHVFGDCTADEGAVLQEEARGGDVAGAKGGGERVVQGAWGMRRGGEEGLDVGEEVRSGGNGEVV